MNKAPKRLGRPVGTGQGREYTKRIEVPASEAQARAYKDAAKRGRVSLAEWVRNACDAAADATVDAEVEKAREVSAALVLSPTPSRAPKKRSEPNPHAVATWDAYRRAYAQRYGAEPIRNARVNGQVSQFLQRVPAEEAPEIAVAYVSSQNARYVSSGHAWGPLLQDAEKLRTEWLTGRTVTAHSARVADKREGRGAEYREVIARLEQREREGVV